MPSYLFYSWSHGSVCLPISFSGRSEDSVGFAEYVWIVGYGCDREEEAFEGRRCKISKLADVVGSAPFKRASQCNLSQSSGRACKRRTDAPPLLQSWDRDCLRGLRPFGQGNLTPAEACIRPHFPKVLFNTLFSLNNKLGATANVSKARDSFWVLQCVYTLAMAVRRLFSKSKSVTWRPINTILPVSFAPSPSEAGASKISNNSLTP